MNDYLNENFGIDFEDLLVEDEPLEQSQDVADRLGLVEGKTYIVKSSPKYDMVNLYQYKSYGNLLNLFDLFDSRYIEPSVDVKTFLREGNTILREATDKDISDLEDFRVKLYSARLDILNKVINVNEDNADGILKTYRLDNVQAPYITRDYIVNNLAEFSKDYK